MYILTLSFVLGQTWMSARQPYIAPICYYSTNHVGWIALLHPSLQQFNVSFLSCFRYFCFYISRNYIIALKLAHGFLLINPDIQLIFSLLNKQPILMYYIKANLGLGALSGWTDSSQSSMRLSQKTGRVTHATRYFSVLFLAISLPPAFIWSFVSTQTIFFKSSWGTTYSWSWPWSTAILFQWLQNAEGFWLSGNQSSFIF